MSLIAEPYCNAGNPLVLSAFPKGARRVLDVGCGGGDNARHLRAAHPGIEVVGLTHSAKEAKIAAPHMDAVHVLDLEYDLTHESMVALGEPFDLLIFSHVLEHLSDPVAALRCCLTRLISGGHVIIAVPNVLHWRTRMQFLLGSFVYTDAGILDRTHLRFYTFNTAPLELIGPVEGLTLVERGGRGSVPLWPLRRLGAARGICAGIDRLGMALLPNLLSSETVMLARWSGDVD